MSLLYECINGIIQGGILDADDSGAEEIASLCVNKLRGMIMIDGDPNCNRTSPRCALERKLIWISKIRCIAGLQQNHHNSSSSCLTAR
jgi:hypothetical protein